MRLKEAAMLQKLLAIHLACCMILVGIASSPAPGDDITPQNAAVAGCAPSQYAALLNGIASLGAERTSLEAARSELRIARKLFETAAADLHAASDLGAAKQALAELRSRVSDAEAEYALRLSAYRQGVLDHAATILPESDVAMLRAAMVNAHRDVPVEYWVLTLSDEAWDSLRTARWKHDRGKELTAVEQQALAAAESDSRVALARARLVQLLPALEGVSQ